MPKQKKLSARDIQAAEEATDLARLRGIARQLGRALALTVQTALDPSGGGAEGDLIWTLDRSWEKLADLIVEFAEGEDDAQGL